MGAKHVYVCVCVYEEDDDGDDNKDVVSNKRKKNSNTWKHVIHILSDYIYRCLYIYTNETKKNTHL